MPDAFGVRGVLARSMREHSIVYAMTSSSRAIASPRLRTRLVAPLARKTELFWWEFESELKRRIALEVLMRKMFALLPTEATS